MRFTIPLRGLLCGLWLGAAVPYSIADEPPKHPGGHPGGHQAGHAGHGGPLVHGFAKAEDWVKQFEGPERDAWQKPQEVVAALGDVKGKTVVDLGAGTGYFLPHLARAVGEGGTVLALDREADMVRYLRERVARPENSKLLGVVKVQEVSGDDPGLPPGSVDRVLIVDVWHHVPERTAYAKKLLAALKPDGAIYIVDFKMSSSHGPPKRHRLTPETVIKELKAAGLFAEVQKSSLPDQYIVVGRRVGAGKP